MTIIIYQNKDTILKLIILIHSLLISCLSFGLSGIEIIKKADTMRFIDADNSFLVEVTDQKGSNTTKTRYKVYSKGSQMSLVETIYPERQAGRKLLMKAQDLWFFTPDIKRPTRVSMQQKLTGEVANGDLARTSFGGDYSVEIKGEETIGDKKAIHLFLKKNKDDVTYSFVDYWVDNKTYMPLKAIFKSDGGKDLKIATYSTPKKFLNYNLITKMEIVNALNKNQKSVLIFASFKKEKLNESFFSKESLSN